MIRDGPSENQLPGRAFSRLSLVFYTVSSLKRLSDSMPLELPDCLLLSFVVLIVRDTAENAVEIDLP